MKPTDDLDTKLDSLLRGLPRERAAADLTPRILARVHRTRTARDPRLVLATALALAAVATLTFAPRVLDRTQAPARGVAGKTAPSRSIQDLETEYRQLRDELAALEQLHAATRPVVYLGGTERADFVLDLGRLARRRPGAWPAQHSPTRDSRARRAAYSTGGSIP